MANYEKEWSDRELQEHIYTNLHTIKTIVATYFALHILAVIILVFIFISR